MHNTIVSLALLKVNWDHLKKDYLENFLPFIATLCFRKDYDVIDTDTICTDFKNAYGLIIPYHPMITILNRARKRGLLKKSHHKLYPVKDKILKLDFTEVSTDQARKNDKVVEEFIKYSKDNFDKTISVEDAELAFLAMLQERDLDILFAAHEGRLFPGLESRKDHQYILNKFIRHVYVSEPDIFSFILNMAIGHVLGNAILYADLTKFEGKLKGVKLYFDTKFILRVLGTEGNERQQHYIEFLNHLLEEKAILRIFLHTYNEIMTILNTCLHWIDNLAYDPTKASMACNFFVQHDYKQSDIDRFIINVDSFLSRNDIEVIREPDPQSYKAFQIDENELHNLIVRIYKQNVPLFDELAAKDMLLRDICSISSIYRLRRGRRPYSLSKTRAIFVTTNNAFALASRKFQRAQKNGGFVYPACLTDVFLGTLVWLQSPARVVAINKRKIIADCYAAIQPSKVLMKRYLKEVDRLKSENRIKEDEYYVLRTHRTALNLLEEKTLGDPNNFTDRTPEEILELIKQEYQAEPTRRYLETQDELEKTKHELVSSRNITESIERRIRQRAMNIASLLGRLFFGILVVLFVVGLLVQVMGGTSLIPTKLRIFLLAITIILGIMNVVTGFNIKEFRDRIVRLIASKTESYFRD